MVHASARSRSCTNVSCSGWSHVLGVVEAALEQTLTQVGGGVVLGEHRQYVKAERTDAS
jgi:hypothetical protein